MLTRTEVRQQGTRAVRRPEVVTGSVAAVLALAYLLAAPTGQDLATGLFRSSFAEAHPLTPVDFQWFGGTTTFGYSLWAPLVIACFGAATTGAVCSVVATVQTTVLLRRGGAVRPLVGGVLAALTQTLNLVEGRTTFSLGLICGLGALLLVTEPPRPPGRPRPWASRRRWVGAGCLAVLCGAASPVAALLLWVCTAALVLTGSVRRGALLFVAGLAPVLVMTLSFGEGGTQSFGGRSLLYGVLATAMVAVGVSDRTVRTGALVGVALLAASYVVPSPVGDNSLRLSLLFAAPLVASFVPWRPWLVALAVVVVAVPQNLGVQNTFITGPQAHAAYYAPLRHEIHALGPLTGRVEIPETSAHWDAYFLGRSLPLARGWLRQLDLRLNADVLFSGRVPPSSYEAFLRRTAVQYVAVPDAPVTVSGQQERDAVARGLPYLRRVWRNAHWSLWAVDGAAPIVAAPGRLVAHTPATLTVRAPAGATVVLSLRWLRWLDVSSGACLEPDGNGHVLLRTTRPGRFVIGSRLLGASDTHCAAGINAGTNDATDAGSAARLP